MLLEKIKNSLRDALSEHLVSMLLVLAGTLICAILGDSVFASRYSFYVELSYKCLFGLAVGVLLSEAIHLYKKKTEGKEHFIVYIILSVVALLGTLQYCLINSYKPIKNLFADYKLAQNISNDVFICLAVIYTALILFYFYKRSDETFESYTAKAFCGLMKAQLVYGIIALGVLMIILAFNVLIYDTSRIDLLGRVEILLLGLVEFPCVLVGLSRTENPVSKFGRVVLSYVFTTLLLGAFVIIYVYIIKILFTWKFPQNEVFSILTALFAFGIAIWTMGYGTCAENLEKPMRILPFLFVPFIVLQIMCLSMRVKQYGFTVSRYLGMALIIFEICYFVLYLIKTIRKSDIMYNVLFMIIAAVVLILFVPGTNMYSVITASQKSKITRYLELGKEATSEEKAAAYEAYRTIRNSGGIYGNTLLNKLLTKEQAEEFAVYDGSKSVPKSFYINTSRKLESLDLSEYSKIYFVTSYYNDGSDKKADIHNFVLKAGEDEKRVGTVDISDIVKKLIDNEELDNSYAANTEAISKVLTTQEGDVFYITSIYFNGDEEEGLSFDYIEVEGMLLTNTER